MNEKFFEFYEANNPRPQSVAPNIPQGQQLGTIDKLAQSIIPRLVDKLNTANWQISRLEALCEQQQASINDLYKFINETALPHMQAVDDNISRLTQEKPVKKTTRTRKKKEVAQAQVDISEIADYDPDTDTWGPIVVGDTAITGSLLKTIESLGSAAGQMYSDEVLEFVAKLEPQVKAAITERFPN